MILVGPLQLRVFCGSVDVHEGRALEFSGKRTAFLRLLMLLFLMVRGASPSWMRPPLFLLPLQVKKTAVELCSLAQCRAGQSR